MKLPFLLRSTHEAHVRAAVEETVRRMREAFGNVLAAEVGRERELRREEIWRRMRAEGLVQFQRDRIQRVLGLPGFADNDVEKESG